MKNQKNNCKNIYIYTNQQDLLISNDAEEVILNPKHIIKVQFFYIINFLNIYNIYMHIQLINSFIKKNTSKEKYIF